MARGEFDPKSTQPMGKIGRPKAELVQTLLGFRTDLPSGSTPVATPAAGSPVAIPVIPAPAEAPAMPAPVAVASPSAVAAPVVYAAVDVSHMSVWGSGDSTKPTVTKTAQGRYTVAYAASYNDGLAVSETVSFFGATVTVRSTDAGDWVFGRPMTLAGSTLTLMTMADAGGWGLVDVGNASAAVFEVEVVLY